MRQFDISSVDAETMVLAANKMSIQKKISKQFLSEQKVTVEITDMAVCHLETEQTENWLTCSVEGSFDEIESFLSGTDVGKVIKCVSE
eukprot:CAMPEP_0171455378 /NCGR_PEP_ID=MMETSP0945-20130129/2297_1 /TAXON_ID=109269 /ORGANISM="Vaucheria litorea, Strain CCMP2940" /LENGTH=87 /DNA_ID=CAMNT_0011980607 /DNA_START=248 /DNA_END=508 /DNA_ORIENTATION=+